MFAKDIQDFSLSLDALRDYNNYIEPLVLNNIKKKYAKAFKEMKCLEVTFEKLEKLARNASNEEIAAAIDDVKIFYKNDIQVKYDEEDKKWTIITSEEDSERIDNAVLNIQNLQKQLELMYKSTLMNIVSSVECFFGDILHRYFIRYKGEIVGKLIESKDKVYTIKELEDFENIEEAKNFVVDKRIENLVRGNFKGWIDFLKNKMELNMGYLKDDINDLEEIFQRRNIFVHNKGIINRIYISNVKEKSRYSNQIGKKINLEKEYLEKAIDLLEKNFILIVSEIWKKREKDEKERTVFLTKLSEKYMIQERWNMLESITTFIVNDACAINAIALQGQINLWLAKKRQGILNTAEVEEYDFTANNLAYCACQAALLDNNKETLRLLKLALDTQQISHKDLFEWPVFAEFRKTELFAGLIKEHNICEPEPRNLIYPELDVECENCEEKV